MPILIGATLDDDLDRLPWEDPPPGAHAESTDPTLPDWPQPSQTPPPPAPQLKRESELVAEVSTLVGVNPDEILRQMREHVEARHVAALSISRLRAEAASLEAKYGKIGGGMNQSHYEHERSAELAMISEDLRAQHVRENPDAKPLTDGRVGDMARATVRYQRALEKSEGERRDYAKIQSDISKAFAEKEYREGMIAYCTETLDTIRSMLYHNRSERQRTMT